MVFHWSLSHSKSPQVSRTFLSFLADLNNAVVLIVFTCTPISKSHSPCINPLVTVPRTPITIGIVTFMFHSFFQFSSTVQVLILLFPFLRLFLSFHSSWTFHICFNWLSFTGAWMLVSVLRSRGFFRIFADVNFAMVWMASIRQLITLSFGPFIWVPSLFILIMVQSIL